MSSKRMQLNYSVSIMASFTIIEESVLQQLVKSNLPNTQVNGNSNTLPSFNELVIHTLWSNSWRIGDANYFTYWYVYDLKERWKTKRFQKSTDCRRWSNVSHHTSVTDIRARLLLWTCQFFFHSLSPLHKEQNEPCFIETLKYGCVTVTSCVASALVI